MKDEHRNVIDGSTLVPLARVAAIVGTIFASALWVSNRLGSIDNRLDRIEETIKNNWTQGDMTLWAERLQSRNPGKLDVPSTVLK